MRLLNTQTLRLEEFIANVPPYAILSHCWEVDEVTFEEVYSLSGSDEAIKDKAGWQKVRHCCQQTLREGFHYAWVDTCCINKSSSAELSEAINSMFRWYRDAAVCYAYLADVPTLSDEATFFRSRWFTRGWTLQELIAPREVVFLDASWNSSTTRRLVANKIHQHIGIDVAILLGSRPPRAYSVAQRFSWAARRSTTRIEDQAYSLLGLFGVHMPLLYGEGVNAFLRLQEEVLRVEQDLSIFAWSIPRFTDCGDVEGRILPLAPSLAFFTHCDGIISATSSEQRISRNPNITINAHSLSLTTRVIKIPSNVLGAPDKIAAVLDCRHADDITKLIAMELHLVAQSSIATSMQSSEVLTLKCNNRTFFLRDRIMLVDIFEVAKSSVTRSILIQRIRPWSEMVNFDKDTRYSHVWPRFENPLLDRNWSVLAAFPERYWTLENRTFNAIAAYADERRMTIPTYRTKSSIGLGAAIAMSDGLQNQIVIYCQVQFRLTFHNKVKFWLEHYNPDIFSLLDRNFEDLDDGTSQSLRLHDGTLFVVRMCEDLVTDKHIAHLAMTVE